MNWEHKIEIRVILIASMTTVISLIISFNYPSLQILVLTILTILLPVTYQIGHIISKEIIRARNEADFFILEKSIEEIKRENRLLKEEVV